MAPRTARGRLPVLDHLKAAAIVAVVVTHAGRAPWHAARSDWDFLLTKSWTSFHIPTFLFVSGFLYARGARSGSREIGRRLARVLLPYLVASTVVQVLGLSRARCGRGHAPAVCLRDVLFDYVTASSLGVYYYVLLIAFCIGTTWFLARAPRWALWAAWCGCLSYTALVDFHPATRLAVAFTSDARFWSLRDPLSQFHLGFFLSGWLAALVLPRLAAARDRWPVTVLGACALLGAAGVLARGGRLFPVGSGIPRVLYSFGVIGLLAVGLRARAPGRLATFLSEASLGLYLFHGVVERLAEPVTYHWPAPLRILAQAGVGLGGAGAALLLGRRLLGRGAARRWLGA
jgi:fucose 4-O-acetylase-like acetyltransferase